MLFCLGLLVLSGYYSRIKSSRSSALAHQELTPSVAVLSCKDVVARSCNDNVLTAIADVSHKQAT